MADMERSLVLIKPEAVESGIIGTIISVYEDNGLRVIAMKMLKLDEKFASEHYAEHKGKSFYNELIEYITSSNLVAMVVEGEDAIEKIRQINGNTDPDKAAYGTIRRRYGKDKTHNAVHASDSIESAKKEIAHWFPEFK